MTSQKLNVALVGATGKLGREIALFLSQKPSIHLRILARPESKGPITLPEGTYELIKVDFNDPLALTSSLQDIHTVISAVNGGPEVSLTLQLNLLQASINAGVKRFAPALFGSNVRHIREGDFNLYTAKLPVVRELEKHVAAGAIKPLWFISGVFTDLALSMFIQDRDQPSPRLEYWGTGQDRFHVTSLADVGRFAAEVVSNQENEGWFTVGGEEVTFLKLADIFEELSGKKVRRICMGSLDDLRARIAEMKGNPSLFYPTALLQIMELVSRGAVDNSQNQNELLGAGYHFKSFKEIYAGKL